jgi:hypothetical protein
MKKRGFKTVPIYRQKLFCANIIIQATVSAYLTEQEKEDLNTKTYV